MEGLPWPVSWNTIEDRQSHIALSPLGGDLLPCDPLALDNEGKRVMTACVVDSADA